MRSLVIALTKTLPRAKTQLAPQVFTLDIRPVERQKLRACFRRTRYGPAWIPHPKSHNLLGPQPGFIIKAY